MPASSNRTFIVDLIKVMGCGVELGGKHNKELATFQPRQPAVQ